jgi:RimJ/RimL family protein N-acetyltransferase
MIIGERIRLRRNERADISKFVAWLNDPEVRRYLSLNMPISMANEEQWFENMLKLPASEQPFAIEIRKTSPEKEAEAWKIIGNCSFMDIDHTALSAEVGLFIGDKSCWNKGYGTEVMRLLLRFGFGTLNLNRIFLRVDEANKRGIRAYEKAGFVHEGHLRQAVYRDGQYEDMLIMSVLRSEWDPGEQSKE